MIKPNLENEKFPYPTRKRSILDKTLALAKSFRHEKNGHVGIRRTFFWKKYQISRPQRVKNEEIKDWLKIEKTSVAVF